jgi:hypothetical protein
LLGFWYLTFNILNSKRRRTNQLCQAFFPSAPNPTPEVMNWSSLIFGLVLIFSLVFYFFKKRHEYRGPVAAIRDAEEVGYAIDLGDVKK